ncbi:MAG: diguanylate cyclase [Oscillospiraceae bacterium]|nr:diguanylate cyclase [Oscillospiraceae bacterium]
MSRKSIAVCVTGFDKETELRVLLGIKERSAELDVNVLLFDSLIRRPSSDLGEYVSEEVLSGESAIYDLLDVTDVIGIITFGDSFASESIFEKVCEKAKKLSIPLVNINDPVHTTDYNITLSEDKAMELVIEHLAGHHGFRRINFVGGFPGNPQTEQRLAAYKRVLERHNIPVEPERIGYGHFWKQAVDCVKEFLSRGQHPEAIACINDTMAVFIMDYLKNENITDIVVTGFDGISDCDQYSPTITSVRKNFGEAGRKAVDVLCSVHDGHNPPTSIQLDSELLIRQSCGCNAPEKRYADFYNDKYGDLNKYKQLTRRLHDMNVRLSNAETPEGFFAATSYIKNYFGFNTFDVCICSDVDDISRKGLEVSPTLVYMAGDAPGVPCGTSFPVRELLPYDFKNGEKPAFMCFSPLYYKDKFLGYIAYDPDSEEQFADCEDFLSTWIISLSNSAGAFYLRKELENLYIRDTLTGAYNRRGLSQLVRIMFSRRDKRYITVMCSDIDNLKQINDKFGHEAGDVVIREAAHSLMAAFDTDSACFRMGGDEFTLIIGHDDVSEIQRRLSVMENKLSVFNSVSGLEYKAGCSCGWVTLPIESITDFETMQSEADKRMYEVKRKKKAVR